MNEILEKYNSSRFAECVVLLEKEIQKESSLIENCAIQNCIEICQCLVIISRNDSSQINDTLRNLYKSYQNTIATGLPGVLIPLQLELTCLFNFVWWSLFYINSESNVNTDRQRCLPIIQRGLRRVSGLPCKFNNSDNIIVDLMCDIQNVGKNIKIRDYSTMCLLTEVIVLTLMYILKTDCSKNVLVMCLETITAVIEDLEKLGIELKAVREFEDPCPLNEILFKFDFVKINSTVSEISMIAIDCMHIIKSLCFILLKKYEQVLFVVKRKMNSAMKPLWYYIGGLSALMLQDHNQCLGFVVMSEGLKLVDGLKSRFCVLHGQLLSRKEDYKEALKCFMEAKIISPSNVAAYYYMGEEYGKIGLSDKMVDCFQDAIQVKREYKFRNVCPFKTRFESVILDLIHPKDEILESEVIYAAAVASGLIEKYQESTEMFEKYMKIRQLEGERVLIGDRIIKTPGTVIVLHEIAAMNIAIENFSCAEYFLSKAEDHYYRVEDVIELPKKDVHVAKDVNWLRNLLREELGLNGEVSLEKNYSHDLFSEEMVHFFEEDVIALMLSAEIKSRIDEDAYKETLGRLISIFSKYLAQMQRKQSIPEEEKMRLTLVKALSGKTCLKIANYQIKKKISGVEIERTFKRALSCNQGDKDILYGYYKFLLEGGKPGDAHKLWETFREKEPHATAEQCQSLALRYLLKTQVTRVELENIAVTLNTSAIDVDFHL